MILLVDNHSKIIKAIEEILKKFKIKYIKKKQNALFKTIEKHKYKGVILSGGVPDLDEKTFVKCIRANTACMINYNVPILGICEGHQIISLSCGGEVIKLKRPVEDHTNKVRILKRSKIFRGLPKVIEGHEHHGRHVVGVPHHLEVVASSRRTRIEAVFHKTKPIFGVQFHPERSGKWGEKIMKNFFDICYKKK